MVWKAIHSTAKAASIQTDHNALAASPIKRCAGLHGPPAGAGRLQRLRRGRSGRTAVIGHGCHPTAGATSTPNRGNSHCASFAAHCLLPALRVISARHGRGFTHDIAPDVARAAGLPRCGRRRSSASSSRPSMSAPTFRSWSSGSPRFSPAATGRCCSSTTIRPTARRRVARAHRRSRRPRALHAPHRPARPCRRLPRRHAGEPGALSRRHGCRPAARRDAARRHARPPAQRAIRSRGGEPLSAAAAPPPGSPNSAPAPAVSPTCWCSACSASHLTDPMSGYFMIRRDAFEPLAPAMSSQGFKILLDILATIARPPARRRAAVRVFTSAATAKASSTARSRSTLPRW